MQILVTNIQLDHRTGTEIVVRDVALGLRRRGHQVTVYTPHSGPIADELVAGDVPVVDRIDKVPFSPDIVHGHHHAPVVDALTRFYDVPAIWVCHDRFGYQDIPPVHPGINRYVAVDLNCRERLVEAGIAEDHIQLIHNAVELERVHRRLELPTTITKAAVFSNNAQPGGFLDVIANGCQRLGIPLDVIGDAAGTSSNAPELLLGKYDVVFAKARCALEALASGCAVVLIDHVGLGPMVTTENMALLRDWNFGARCLQGRPTAERIVTELQRFNPSDAALVTDWIRQSADLQRSLDQYLHLYEEAIDEGPPVRPVQSVPPSELALHYAAALEQRLRLLQAPIVSLPLPPTIGAEVRLTARTPKPRVLPGETFGLEVNVSNGSNETLASIGRYPVNLSYHWVCPENQPPNLAEGVRTLLGQPLYPGAAATLRMAVLAPEMAGHYVLRASLVQESVFWFDELTPPIACWVPIEVNASSENDGPTRPEMTLAGLIAASFPSVACDVRVFRDGVFSGLGFVDDPGEQMMVFADSERFVRRAIDNCAVTCIVTTEDLGDLIPFDRGLLVAADPKDAFFQIHNWLAGNTALFSDNRATSVAESAVVDTSASIDPDAVFIGDHCVIGPNVVIHGPAYLGPRTKVDAGAVIGSSAFQTSHRSGEYVELRHVGGVSIGADCHIYSNASIARGVFRACTEIGDRCQIGNGAFVSHQCRLGRNVFVGHNATVNGRVNIGDEVWIGPGAVISNDLTIGAGAHVALGSTVMHSVPEKARVSGLPAVDQHAMFRHAATIRKRR